MAADLLQEQRHRICGPLGQVAVGVARLLDPVATAVVAQVEPALLQHVVHNLRVLIAKIGLLDKLAQLRQLDAGVSARLRAPDELVHELLDRLGNDRMLTLTGHVFLLPRPETIRTR